MTRTSGRKKSAAHAIASAVVEKETVLGGGEAGITKYAVDTATLQAEESELRSLYAGKDGDLDDSENVAFRKFRSSDTSNGNSVYVVCSRFHPTGTLQGNATKQKSLTLRFLATDGARVWESIVDAASSKHPSLEHIDDDEYLATLFNTFQSSRPDTASGGKDDKPTQRAPDASFLVELAIPNSHSELKEVKVDVFQKFGVVSAKFATFKLFLSFERMEEEAANASSSVQKVLEQLLVDRVLLRAYLAKCQEGLDSLKRRVDEQNDTISQLLRQKEETDARLLSNLEELLAEKKNFFATKIAEARLLAPSKDGGQGTEEEGDEEEKSGKESVDSADTVDADYLDEPGLATTQESSPLKTTQASSTSSRRETQGRSSLSSSSKDLKGGSMSASQLLTQLSQEEQEWRQTQVLTGSSQRQSPEKAGNSHSSPSSSPARVKNERQSRQKSSLARGAGEQASNDDLAAAKSVLTQKPLPQDNRPSPSRRAPKRRKFSDLSSDNEDDILGSIL